jgi:hypothetical protein
MKKPLVQKPAAFLIAAAQSARERGSRRQILLSILQNRVRSSYLKPERAIGSSERIASLRPASVTRPIKGHKTFLKECDEFALHQGEEKW